MDVKRYIKKMTALGMGAGMIGATMIGASAVTLDQYPTDWIENGMFNGKIVVGQDAATSDVLGAIDIAASIQAASVSEDDVDVPGTGGKILLGDSVEIGSSNDLLTLNEPIGDTRETITEYELDALKGGVISTDEGSTAYKQYLRFKSGTQLFPTAVIYGENDASQEEVGDFLYIAEGNDVTQDAFFEWEIEFEEGLESEISSQGSQLQLKDLEDEVFNIFGTDFVFVDSRISGSSSAPDVTLDFIAGDVTDVLQEGETKTYTLDGKDYEITLVFVSNPNSGSVEAKLSVNGELTDALGDGGTDIMSDGLEIGIQEILVSSRGGVVEFFLGATKVQFRDTNTADSDFYNGVEITNEKIEDGFVSIRGQVIGSGSIAAGDDFEITSIRYRLTADAVSGTTNLYIPPGHSIREFLDEPEGLLSPNFDIRYEGLRQVSESTIEIDSRGDDEYRIRAENRQGNVYEIPYVEVSSGGTFRFGEDNNENLVFVEDSDFDTQLAASNLSQSDFFISSDDNFVIWNARDDEWDDQAFSHVLAYQSIDTNQNVITFEDLATGTKEFTYSSHSDPDVLGSGDLIVGGNAYKVYVGNFSGNPIAIDLNGDGRIEGDKSKFTTRGGGVIDFDLQTNSTTGFRTLGSSDTVTFVLHTEASKFDESSDGDEQLYMSIGKTSDDALTMSFEGYNRTDVSLSGANSTIDRTESVYIEGVGQVATSGRYSGFEFSPTEPDNNRDHQLEMTDYGVLFDFHDPSGSNPEELMLTYPHSQRGVQVFVTAGPVTSQNSSTKTTKVNPIAVGLAVLDVDAPNVGSENMIVIGGPCINSVAAELMGVSYPACGEDAEELGFEPGKAMIRLFENDNAILVAGYEAEETLAASYVLADYGSYDLEGTEIEVTVDGLDDITVTRVD